MMSKRRYLLNHRERGSMAVEVVLLMPILVIFMLLVVAGGRYVTTQADIQAAARDAARAASYERSAGAAEAAARTVARNALGSGSACTVINVDNSQFRAGGIVEVRLECSVDNGGLSLIGLKGRTEMQATGSAPLDTYRRTE